MPVVSMKNLLESGVHFGHQTKRWDPKMKPYIYTERNDIYIIDLEQTLQLVEKAYEYVKNLTEAGGKILFVGTKRQAQDTIKEEAERASMPYVNKRWLGGTLTNFETIRSRVKHLKNLKDMEESGRINALTKKEGVLIRKEIKKLEDNLGGIVQMERLPEALFIVDPKNEQIATAEARRLNIPIIAIVDTNCNPEEVDYVVPGNDDAIRSIALITKTVAEAAVEGSAKIKIEKPEESKEEGKEAVKPSKEEKAKVEEKAKEATTAPTLPKGKVGVPAEDSKGTESVGKEKPQNKKAAGKEEVKKAPTQNKDEVGVPTENVGKEKAAEKETASPEDSKEDKEGNKED